MELDDQDALGAAVHLQAAVGVEILGLIRLHGGICFLARTAGSKSTTITKGQESRLHETDLILLAWSPAGVGSCDPGRHC
jgi:hypothetical protein